jgi:hypothetical protein
MRRKSNTIQIINEASRQSQVIHGGQHWFLIQTENGKNKQLGKILAISLPASHRRHAGSCGRNVPVNGMALRLCAGTFFGTSLGKQSNASKPQGIRESV